MQYNFLQVFFQFLTDTASTAVIFKIITVLPLHIINFTVDLDGGCHGNINYLQMVTVKRCMVTMTLYRTPKYSDSERCQR